MNSFVILFRPPTKPLSDAERRQLTQETGIWARRQNDAGHALDPRIFGPESAVYGPREGADERPVSGLLFLQAADLGAAGRVAESHPALASGYSAEVRPWADPRNNAQPAGPGLQAARQP